MCYNCTTLNLGVLSLVPFLDIILVSSAMSKPLSKLFHFGVHVIDNAHVSFLQVDVYSFGVLLCEMCTREQPDPEQIHNQMSRVTGSLRGLIQRCVERDPEARPTMSDVIRELEQFA